MKNKLVQSDQPVMTADEFDSSDSSIGFRHPIHRDSFDKSERIIGRRNR